MEDKDFKAFCSELKKETPDMAVILNGMEKYGTGEFSDAQRAEFLRKMFPDKSITNRDCGFQDTTGIRNALVAMQQLQAEGKVDAASMKTFLTETNAKGGANVITTLALNIRSAELMLKIRKNGHTEVKNPESRKDAERNLKAMTETLGILAETDGEVLQEALNTPDKTSKKGTLKKYAFDSKILSDFKPKTPTKAPKAPKINKDKPVTEIEDTTATPATESDKLTFEPMAEEAPVKVGGMENGEGETLTVSAKPKDLTVQPKPTPQENEDDDKKKVANLQDSKGDSAGGKSTFDFEPVKEQDIIQYMFNAWFLGGMNAIMKWVFKKADRGADRLIERMESFRTPSASASKTAPQIPASQPTTAPTSIPQTHTDTPISLPDGSAYLRQICNLTNRVSDYYLTNLHVNDMGSNAGSQKYIASLISDIRININREPEKWDAKVLVAARDAPFMEQMGRIHDENPREFEANLDALAANPRQLAGEDMTKLIKVSSNLAAVDFIAKHPGQELDGNEEASKFVMKKTFEKMADFQKSIQQAITQAEIDFRKEKGLAPDAPISATDKLKLTQKACSEFGEQYNTIEEKCLDLEDLMNKHYLEQNPQEKKRLEQEIKQKHQEMTKLQNALLPEKDERSSEGELPAKPAKTTDKKMDIREAAQADIEGQRTERSWVAASATDHAQLDAKTTENDKRKKRYSQGKNRVLGSSSNGRQTGKVAKQAVSGRVAAQND